MAKRSEGPIEARRPTVGVLDDEMVRVLSAKTGGERLNLTYLVTGSMATILYGEPRFTNDIDIVVQLSQSRVADLVQAFPSDEFYLDDERIRQEIENKGQFNIIHPASGLKIDVIIPEMDDFDRSRFARARRVRTAEDYEATFASAEDVIVKKLQFYTEGGGDRPARLLLQS